MKIHLEPGVAADRFRELARELVERFVPAGNLAREQPGAGIGLEDGQAALDIEVEQPRRFLRYRERKINLVLDRLGGEIDVDRRLPSPPFEQEVMVEIEAYEVAPPDRCHQQDLDRQRHLHIAGVGEGDRVFLADPFVDLVRQPEEGLEVLLVGELTQPAPVRGRQPG